MCRHLAYLGPPITLHEPIFGAPHSLSDQARAPEHQGPGRSNPDGWGAGWYASDDNAACVYRTVTPIWDDTAFTERSHTIRSHAFVAAARLASPGATIAESGNAPFRDGRWLFSLNGVVHGFREGAGDVLRDAVSPARRARIEGDADSEVLFALALDRLDEGADHAIAVAAVVEQVLGVTTAALNLLLTDGEVVAATRCGRSLFVRGATIVSEPLDEDPGWHEVPDGSVVLATAEAGEPTHSITAL